VVESLHDDAPDLVRQIDRTVSALQPDGMILTPPLCDNPVVLRALRDGGTPVVLISPAREVRKIPSVRMDDAKAAEEITNLLVSLGHERIGFIRGPDSQIASARREQGFLAAMERHRLSVDRDLMVQGNFIFGSGVEAAHHLLSRRARPTAVFASNDEMALGVLATAQRLGIRVPQDLSIAGFDDFHAASLVWPGLTTVRQPIAGMARAAVELLVGAQEDSGRPAAHLVLPHELVVRDSTCAPSRSLVRSVRRASSESGGQ